MNYPSWSKALSWKVLETALSPELSIYRLRWTRAGALSTQQELARSEAACSGGGITASRNRQAAAIGGSVNRGGEKEAEHKGRFKVFTSCRVFLICLGINLWCPGIQIMIWEKLFWDIKQICRNYREGSSCYKLVRMPRLQRRRFRS